SVSEDFAEHDGKPDAVEESCCDMSPAFISGIGQYLPKSQITFDKLHVMKIINNAVDEVRRQEQKNHPELKKPAHINNGILEGINSLIRAAKAKARGYRSSRNYITMIYLIAGKLDYTLLA
ncbi:transposase, partial [Desulfocicer niacini]